MWRRIAVLSAALAVLLLVFEATPRFGEAFDLFQEWRALHTQLEAAEAAPTERLRLASENERLRQDQEDLLVELPRSDELSVLLGEVQRYASEARVTLRRIQPGEPVVQRTHETLPILLNVTGSYHAVGRFVDHIERSPLLLQISALELSRKPDGPGTVEAIVETEAALLTTDAP